MSLDSLSKEGNANDEMGEMQQMQQMMKDIGIIGVEDISISKMRRIIEDSMKYFQGTFKLSQCPQKIGELAKQIGMEIRKVTEMDVELLKNLRKKIETWFETLDEHDLTEFSEYVQTLDKGVGKKAVRPAPEKVASVLTSGLVPIMAGGSSRKRKETTSPPTTKYANTTANRSDTMQICVFIAIIIIIILIKTFGTEWLMKVSVVGLIIFIFYVLYNIYQGSWMSNKIKEIQKALNELSIDYRANEILYDILLEQEQMKEGGSLYLQEIFCSGGKASVKLILKVMEYEKQEKKLTEELTRLLTIYEGKGFDQYAVFQRHGFAEKKRGAIAAKIITKLTGNNGYIDAILSKSRDDLSKSRDDRKSMPAMQRLFDLKKKQIEHLMKQEYLIAKVKEGKFTLFTNAEITDGKWVPVGNLTTKYERWMPDPTTVKQQAEDTYNLFKNPQEKQKKQKEQKEQEPEETEGPYFDTPLSTGVFQRIKTRHQNYLEGQGTEPEPETEQQDPENPSVYELDGGGGRLHHSKKSKNSKKTRKTRKYKSKRSTKKYTKRVRNNNRKKKKKSTKRRLKGG